MNNTLNKIPFDHSLINNNIVRHNLINDVNYRPYCGSNIARNDIGGCYNPRMQYRSVDSQFICPNCKLITKFPKDFLDFYKKQHNL